MRASRVIALICALLLTGVAPAYPGGRGGGGGPVPVKGYTRKDGTYVPPHTRGLPGGRGAAVTGGPPVSPRLSPPPTGRGVPEPSEQDPIGETPAVPTPAEPPATSRPPAKPVLPAPRSDLTTLWPVAGRLPLGTSPFALEQFDAARDPRQVAELVAQRRLVVFDKPTQVVVLKEWAAAPVLRVQLPDGPRKSDLLYCRREHLTPPSAGAGPGGGPRR